jgi:hypothetical protein
MSIRKLERLPSAPSVAFPPPKKPANDTIADLLDRGAVVFEAAEAKRRGLDRYLAALKSNMDRLVREAEQPTTGIDELTAAIGILLRREKARAKEVLPVVDAIRTARRKFGRSKAGARYRFYRAWEKAFGPIEETLVSELETLRDSRLRLEIRRADLINRGRPEGPVYESADDVLAALHSLTK